MVCRNGTKSSLRLTFRRFLRCFPIQTLMKIASSCATGSYPADVVPCSPMYMTVFVKGGVHSFSVFVNQTIMSDSMRIHSSVQFQAYKRIIHSSIAPPICNNVHCPYDSLNCHSTLLVWPIFVNVCPPPQSPLLSPTSRYQVSSPFHL